MNAPVDLVDRRDAAEPRAPKLDNTVCLFLDVDGTLIDIAEVPDAVTVPAGLRETLARVQAGLDGALAFVSGRPIATLDRLFAPLILPAAGEHGAELRRSPAAAVEEPPRSARLLELDLQLAAVAAQHPGVIIEMKRAAIAVHYRRAPACGPALRAAIEEILDERFADLHLLSGKMVFEIKQRHVNKGTAVLALMERPPFAGRRPIFVGDDTTDADGFRAARALGGLGIPVGHAPDAEASFSFPTPAAVRAWLAEAAEAFASRAGAASR
jgi:trehalose 6-phosphate phosphatase